MGWKSIKEHYKIEHFVHVTSDGICIGSAYIHNLIVIGADGKITGRDNGNFHNENLDRYWKELHADPAKVKELIEAKDHFDRSITVFTYDGGAILEKQCEELGWPNVTHDGCMMYDNSFSADRSEVIAWAIREAECWLRSIAERTQETQERLDKLAADAQVAAANKAALEALAEKVSK